MVIRYRDTDDIVTRPIEDIGIVVIENPMVQATVPLLNALTENNTAVVFCNNKCMPESMLMPLEANTTQQETYRYQIEATQPTKKRIWKEIIECKIRNQALALNKIGKNGNALKPYYSNVLSGDSNNREGAAARIYWQQFFGPEFTRSREGDDPNTLLNYGYAILRAAVARALLGSGLFPVFGLFHRNRYNAFPLADDVMEPYRPYVDLAVKELMQTIPCIELNKESKQQLASVLVADVEIAGQQRPLQVALSITTASLVKALKDKTEHIVYPRII